MATAIPLAPRTPWTSVEQAYAAVESCACGAQLTEFEAAMVGSCAYCKAKRASEAFAASRDADRPTVRCQPRRLWTVPPVVDEREGWTRAIAKGEDQIDTIPAPAQ